MLITIAVVLAMVAIYLDWCEARDDYLERLRERFKKM